MGSNRDNSEKSKSGSKLSKQELDSLDLSGRKKPASKEKSKLYSSDYSSAGELSVSSKCSMDLLSKKDTERRSSLGEDRNLMDSPEKSELNAKPRPKSIDILIN